LEKDFYELEVERVVYWECDEVVEDGNEVGVAQVIG
jgi:hypothetical protein